ncbi:MAG TPA: glycoside hydrolase family 3 C-terminal domain-containing protein [Actinomycetota bacterium]|nr:glycoside hydrolase family 3 C-terminal domain-containing protein [Actinomycetota bacterium]
MEPTTEQIVAGLSLADKVRLVSGRDVWRTEAVAVPGLTHGVQSVMLSDGPHGLRKQEVSGDHLGVGGSRPATCFPTAVTLASSWDPDLLFAVGAAVGAEARSEQVAVVLGPGLNIKRHPYCGRNFEYLSEDPLLSGKLAAAMVRGIQSVGVGACLKHFAANNQETNRLVVDAVVDARALREIYLTGFEIAIKEAKPWTVMAAYNQLNGEYCCENAALLTGILREEWGFTGLVMSDWGGTNDRVAGLLAGLDLEMPGNGGLSDAAVATAIHSGVLSATELDACVRRVVDLARRSAAAPPRQDAPAPAYAHHDLARRVAADCTVLLTNNGLLPLASPCSVAVIGAFAKQPRFQGAGSSLVNPTRVETTMDALLSRADVQVSYAAGYDPVTSVPDDQLLSEAVEAAASTDVVLLMIGLPGSYESEGFDRTHLGLPLQHDRLVESVTAANPNTVVVLSNGSPVAIPWVDRPAAIVEGYLSGQAGGAALVDVLFGDAEPAGRLAETFPRAAADVPSDPYFPGAPRQVEYREGIYVGYRYYDSAGTPVLFPFGHGLSYTTFEFGSVSATPTEVRVTVSNSGRRRGAEVVQVYVHDLEASVHRPEQELRAFSKVWLDPGESREVVLPLNHRAFASYDVGAAGWLVEAGDFEIRVGASSRDIRGTAVVSVDSDRAPAPSLAPPGLVAHGDAAFAAMLGRPIPTAPNRRPFTRTSQVGDLQGSTVGRILRRVLYRGLTPGLSKVAGGDDVLAKKMVRAVDEAPLRSIAQFGGGRVTWAELDGLLDVLNGRPVAALGRAARGVSAAIANASRR